METQSSVKMEDQRNKETVNLLDLFSDSESAVSDLVLTPRKKKFKRRYRSGSSVRVKRSNSCACGKSQSRVISLWLATILITIWLIALSWLAALLYSDIGKMDASIRAALESDLRWVVDNDVIMYILLVIVPLVLFKYKKP